MDRQIAKIAEVMYAEFPQLMTRAGQTEMTWLINNGWELVTEATVDQQAVLKCPLTKDNYVLDQALGRQEQRPLEDVVVLALKRFNVGTPSVDAQVETLCKQVAELNAEAVTLDTAVRAKVAGLDSALATSKASVDALLADLAAAHERIAELEAKLVASTAQGATAPAPEAVSASPTPTA